MLKFGTLLTVLLIGLVAGTASQGHAEPVTLRFDAEVSSIQGDIDQFDLPFSVQPGDSFPGTLTFTTEEDLRAMLLGGVQPQPVGGLFLNIDGIQITNAFNFGSINKALIDLSNPQPNLGSKSAISLGWLPLTDAFPGFAGSVNGVPWNAEISLVGEDGIIGETESITSFDNWNALVESRRLILTFGATGAARVDLTVGHFVVVPEPSTGCLAYFVAIVLAVYYRVHR